MRDAALWGTIVTIILALLGSLTSLSGRLSVAETKADHAIEATQYYRQIDQRLSRIEGKLGVER